MLSGITPQRVLGGAFDPRSGEALLVYSEAVFAPFPSRQLTDATQARRFSALGEPLGEAVVIPEFEPDSAFFSARAGESWVVMTDAQPPTFRVVGGPHNGASHPITSGLCEGPSCQPILQFHGLAPAPDGRVEALFSDSRQNYSALIDGRTLLSAPGRPPPPGLVAQTAIGSSMALRDAEGALALWFASPDGTVALLDAAPDGHKPSYNATVYQVWGDLVVVVQVDRKTASATWLKAAKAVSFSADKLDGDSGEQVLRARLPGPVLPGGRWILPDTPGEPFEAPKALADALRECSVRLPTGPRRLLLGCSEIAPEQPFAPRVGARVVRY